MDACLAVFEQIDMLSRFSNRSEAMKTWKTKELVDYTIGTKYEDYPKEVIEITKMFILDSLGCALGGSVSALGQAVLSPFKAMGGAAEATLIGGQMKVPCIQASFVNGTTTNALDFDDTLLGIGHPGASAIPAALAFGEARSVPGKDILNAIITAYDVGDRIGLAIQPSYDRLQKVWGVGTWQTFSAAVAAAKTMNLNKAQMFNTFGVAGATAPLPNTQKWGWDSDERPIHWVKEPTGWPCWTGATAAVLSESGFIGNRYILDGDNGFWIMAGSDRCDFDKMTANLGTHFEIAKNIAIKPYSCCRWEHAALDGIKQIKQENKLQHDDVKEILINSFAWVKSHELYDPDGLVDAQFCMPYTATMVMLGKVPGPEWYTEENLKSEAVSRFSRKVKVTIDPELDQKYFEKDQLSARVNITTHNGDSFVKFVEIPTGDPRHPLPIEDVEAKFKSQAAFVLNDDQISQVMELVYDFENLQNIKSLMALLAGN